MLLRSTFRESRFAPALLYNCPSFQYVIGRTILPTVQTGAVALLLSMLTLVLGGASFRRLGIYTRLPDFVQSRIKLWHRVVGAAWPMWSGRSGTFAGPVLTFVSYQEAEDAKG